VRCAGKVYALGKGVRMGIGEEQRRGLTAAKHRRIRILKVHLLRIVANVPRVTLRWQDGGNALHEGIAVVVHAVRELGVHVEPTHG